MEADRTQNRSTLVICKEGHSYDSSRYDSCPWCPKKKGLFGIGKRSKRIKHTGKTGSNETDIISLNNGHENETDVMEPGGQRMGSETDIMQTVSDKSRETKTVLLNVSDEQEKI